MGRAVNRPAPYQILSKIMVSEMIAPRNSVAFSGTRVGMTPQQMSTLTQVLKDCRYQRILESDAPLMFRHGDCVGADDTAARIAKGLDFYVVCHPPINPKLRAFTDFND